MNCPQMSLRKPPEARRQYIKNHIVSKEIMEIARICGVNEKTIDRDIAHMKETGEWHEWLEVFLLTLYSSDEVSDEAKLRSVTMLYGKTIVQRREVKTEGDYSLNLMAWRPKKEKREDA